MLSATPRMTFRPTRPYIAGRVVRMPSLVSFICPAPRRVGGFFCGGVRP